MAINRLEVDTLTSVAQVLGGELMIQAKNTYDFHQGGLPALGVHWSAWNLLQEARRRYQEKTISDNELLAAQILYGFFLYVLTHKDKPEYQGYVAIISQLHQQLAANDFPLQVELDVIAKTFQYLSR